MRSISLLLVITLAVFAGLGLTKPISSPVEEVTTENIGESTEPRAHEREHQTLNEEIQTVASNKEPADIASHASRERKYSSNPEKVTER